MYVEKDSGGKIVAIQTSEINFESRIELGDMVVSNGRIFVPAGTKGIVVGFGEQFIGSRTNNVIDVVWENSSYPECPDSMKYKDLDIEALKKLNLLRHKQQQPAQ